MSIAVRDAPPEDLRVEQLRVLVTKRLESAAGAPIAVRVDAELGIERLELGPSAGAGPLRVVESCSPLGLRAALVDHYHHDHGHDHGHHQDQGEHQDQARGGPLVILTTLAEVDLGEDLLARFHKAKLYHLDRWQTVAALFGAHKVSRGLAEKRHLADALISSPRPARYPAAPGTLIDVDFALEALVSHKLGLPDQARTPAGLLVWASTPEAAAALGPLDTDTRTDLDDHLRERYGEVVDAIAALSAAGNAAELVAVGLAAGVVWHPDSGADRARGRFAATWAGQADPAPSVWNALAAAAHQAVVEDDSPDGQAAGWLRRGDEILAAAGADAVAVAHLSRVLPRSFEARLAGAGDAIGAALAVRAETGLGSPGLTRLHEAVGSALDHRGAAVDRGRGERLAMAARLVRALGKAAPEWTTIVDAVSWYDDEGAHLDRARVQVARGDTEPSLAAAYESLIERWDARRGAGNERFAALAVSLGQRVPAELVGGEQIIERVIAPLAESVPVLLIVADGMALATYAELADELAALGWVHHATTDGAGARPAVAVFPTVTEAARTSLFAGTVRTGDQDSERRAFRDHPALAAPSGSSDGEPVVFHRADLVGGSANRVPGEVLDTVAGADRRVVGVVINTVDDHLDKGDQLPVAWTLDTIGPLRELLAAADAAGRAVVITADHGHLVSRDTAQAATSGDAGQRWRRADRAAGQGEIEVRGSRVALGDGTVIMPWSETIRYGTPKAGYHGGITPQEVLVPLAVLSTGEIGEGWQPRSPAKPSWWYTDGPTEIAERVEPAAVARPLVIAPTLFDEPAPAVAVPAAGRPTSTGWVDAVLGSPIYPAQRKKGRLRLTDDQVRALLVALDGFGGDPVDQARLAELAREPVARINGFVGQLQKLCNVDGYPVVSRSGVEVSLDRELLLRQFGGEAR